MFGVGLSASQSGRCSGETLRVNLCPAMRQGSRVADHHKQGFRAFKLACPWGPDRVLALEETVRVVEHARSIIGNEAPLMLDCWAVNRAEDAIAIAEAMEPYNLGWIEDFVQPDDRAGYREVRSGTPHLLASGERWYSVEAFSTAIDERWVDIVQPDALWVGGVTPTVRIAAAAASGGRRFCLCTAEPTIPLGNISHSRYRKNLCGRDLHRIAARRVSDGLVSGNPWHGTPRCWRLSRPSDAPGFGHRADVEGRCRCVPLVDRNWRASNGPRAPLTTAGHDQEDRDLRTTWSGHHVPTPNHSMVGLW